VLHTVVFFECLNEAQHLRSLLASELDVIPVTRAGSRYTTATRRLVAEVEMENSLGSRSFGLLSNLDK